MILFFEEYMTHYRVKVYESVQKKLGRRVFVVHGEKPKGSCLNTISNEEALPFGHEKVRTYWSPRNIVSVRNVTGAVKKYDPSHVIIRGTIRNLELIPLMVYYKISYVPVLVWGQGYSMNRPFMPHNNLFDLVYLIVAKYCDAYICYTEDIKKTLSEFVNSKKLFVANNTVDTEAIRKNYEEFEKEGKESLKCGLGLHAKSYALFIGRLMERKRVGMLLRSVSYLQDEVGLDIGVIIIGDGPERNRLVEMSRYLSLYECHFPGEKYGSDAGKYIYSSDVVVIPGALGLAVNHALAYGRPVVSQVEPGAENSLVGNGPEAMHILNKPTGLLVRGQEPSDLARGINEVLKNQQSYSQSALRYSVKNLSMENMVSGFENAINHF